MSQPESLPRIVPPHYIIPTNQSQTSPRAPASQRARPRADRDLHLERASPAVHSLLVFALLCYRMKPPSIRRARVCSRQYSQRTFGSLSNRQRRTIGTRVSVSALRTSPRQDDLWTGLHDTTIAICRLAIKIQPREVTLSDHHRTQLCRDTANHQVQSRLRPRAFRLVF